MQFSPIGRFRTPFAETAGMPLQPAGAVGVQGAIEIFAPFEPGLADLDGFSHIIVLYHLHRAERHLLHLRPCLNGREDDRERGIFATRSQRRPNPLGLSVLKLVSVRGPVLRVANVDVLDGTPVLDIKPYVPDFDVWPADRLGWLEGLAPAVAEARCEVSAPSAAPAPDHAARESAGRVPGHAAGPAGGSR